MPRVCDGYPISPERVLAPDDNRRCSDRRMIPVRGGLGRQRRGKYAARTGLAALRRHRLQTEDMREGAMDAQTSRQSRIGGDGN